MIKKIILIFVLFTISLFGQVKEVYSDGMCLTEIKIKARDNNEFLISIFQHDEALDFTVHLAGVFAGDETASMEIEDLFLDTPTFYNTSCWFEITKVKDMKYILQKIIEGKKMHFRIRYSNYSIDFSKYKNDIIKSKLYNYIMKL